MNALDLARVEDLVAKGEPLDGRVLLGEGGVVLLVAGQPVRAGHVRHGCLVAQTALGNLKRRRQVEDGPTVLDAHDPSRREALAVADAVDFKKDRPLPITAPQEVRVYRMDQPVAVDRTRSRNDRLAQHLPTKDMGTRPVGRSKQVLLDLLELEKGEEVGGGVGQGKSSSERSLACASWSTVPAAIALANR